MDEVLATFHCLVNELTENGNEDLARLVVVNCLTSIPIHNVRKFLEDKKPIRLYRADSESLEATILSMCVLGKQGDFCIMTRDLISLLYSASRGSLYVSLPNLSNKHHDEVKVLTKAVVGAVGQEHKKLVEELAERASELKKKTKQEAAILLVSLHDQAAARLSSRAF